MAVTRNDVARAAGVSPAVVSYVLNSGPRPVSAHARERVLAAVADLGYRPDGLARSLRIGSTRTLGLVLPDATNPFFAELARAIEDAAYARGYAVMVCNSADDAERERTYVASLGERRIDGLFLVSVADAADLRAVTDLAIPVIALDRSPDEAPVSTIRAENAAGARLGVEHLLSHGHERIAFVGGPDAGVTDARRDGYASALHSRGLEGAAAVRVPFSYEGGRAAVRSLFAVDDAARPTAILVASDVQAIGMLRDLAALGLRVPDDVALVSVDGTEAGAFCVPGLTAIAQPVEVMATAAVTHLVDGARSIVHLAFDTTLVVRESCGCASPRPD